VRDSAPGGYRLDDRSVDECPQPGARAAADVEHGSRVGHGLQCELRAALDDSSVELSPPARARRSLPGDRTDRRRWRARAAVSGASSPVHVGEAERGQFARAVQNGRQLLTRPRQHHGDLHLVEAPRPWRSGMKGAANHASTATCRRRTEPRGRTPAAPARRGPRRRSRGAGRLPARRADRLPPATRATHDPQSRPSLRPPRDGTRMTS
jgi:hypothetical protein